MIFGTTETVFKASAAKFKECAPQQVLQCFVDNWEHQEHLWAAYRTNATGNLGNSTNNRLESHDQMIKDVLSRNCTLSEALRGLLQLSKSREESSSNEAFN